MAFQDDEMNDFEQKLFQNGFSAKHIRKLNEILTRDEKKIIYTSASHSED